MREFLLLRHGKSDYPPDVYDFDRPLAKRGEKDTVKIGQWLREYGHVPDRIVTSPAARAANTATRLVRSLNMDPTQIVEEELLYLALPERILEVLRAQPDSAKRVLFVGHNPGLEDLTALLSGQPGPFPTAALAVFGVTGKWRDFAPKFAAPVMTVRPRDLG
ncbi:MAG: histidine phosphatase family protein [Alphaproteobacteria bacterium]